MERKRDEKDLSKRGFYKKKGDGIDPRTKRGLDSRKHQKTKRDDLLNKARFSSDEDANTSTAVEEPKCSKGRIFTADLPAVVEFKIQISMSEMKMESRLYMFLFC